MWPYVRGLNAVEPAVVDTVESGHVAMANACGTATSAIDAVATDPTTARATAAADAVAEAARVTSDHLDHEESAITPLSRVFGAVVSPQDRASLAVTRVP